MLNVDFGKSVLSSDNLSTNLFQSFMCWQYLSIDRPSCVNNICWAFLLLSVSYITLKNDEQLFLLKSACAVSAGTLILFSFANIEVISLLHLRLAITRACTVMWPEKVYACFLWFFFFEMRNPSQILKQLLYICKLVFLFVSTWPHMKTFWKVYTSLVSGNLFFSLNFTWPHNWICQF